MNRFRKIAEDPKASLDPLNPHLPRTKHETRLPKPPERRRSLALIEKMLYKLRKHNVKLAGYIFLLYS